LALSVQAQTASVFTVGLQAPTKIITAGDDALLVSEARTLVANTGRVSLVNRTTGARRTLVGGLPSGLKLIDQTLYLAIGLGNSVMNVGPGLELPNPNSSSQIFDSVMALRARSLNKTRHSPLTPVCGKS